MYYCMYAGRGALPSATQAGYDNRAKVDFAGGAPQNTDHQMEVEWDCVARAYGD